MADSTTTNSTPPSLNQDGAVPKETGREINQQKNETSRNDTTASLSSPAQQPFLPIRLQQTWSRMMDRVRDGIVWVVVTLAVHAARHPKAYVGGVVFLTFALLGVGFATNFNYHTQTDEQMTAYWSRIRGQKYYIEEEFPPRPYSLQVIVHAQGDNILTRNGIEHMMQAVESVTSTPSYQSVCEGNDDPKDASGGLQSICSIRGITLFWNHSMDIAQEALQSEVDVILTANQDHYPDGSEVYIGEIMGRTTQNYDTVTEAQSFSLTIQIPFTDISKDAAIDVLNSLLGLRGQWLAKEELYSLEVMMADYSMEQEMVNAAFKDIPLVPVVFVIMTIFTCFVFSTSRKQGSLDNPEEGTRRHQRILLGLGTVVTVAMSIGSSYGLLWIIGKQEDSPYFKFLHHCSPLITVCFFGFMTCTYRSPLYIHIPNLAICHVWNRLG